MGSDVTSTIKDTTMKLRKLVSNTILTLKDVEEMNTLTRAPKCKHEVGDRVALHIEGHRVVTKVISLNDEHDSEVYKHVKYVCKVRTRVTSLYGAFKYEIV